jgi:hypothetical protein
MTKFLNHRRCDSRLHAGPDAKNDSAADEHSNTGRKSVHYRPNDAEDRASK